MAPLTGVSRGAALSVRAPPRRSRRFRLGMALSVLAHVLAVLALLLSFRRREASDLLPPPSPVTMVFESGHKAEPTVPKPSVAATPSQPTPAEAKAAPSEPAPSPAAPTPPQAKPVPTPPRVQPAKPPPALEPTPAAPAKPLASAEPQPPVKQAPPLPAPQASAPTVTLPLPPAPAAPPLPDLQPAPPLPRLAEPAPPRAAEKPRTAREAAKPSPSTAFPAPMNYSFGTPPRGNARGTPHRRGGIDLSFGPAAKGELDITPFGPHAHDAAIADWSNVLHQWVVDHAYYPPEAVREAQEGDSMVHVLVQPDGKVTRVELVGRSGSVWLDAALLALFRDQHIPPLPSGENQPFEFDFTMHYILLREPP